MICQIEKHVLCNILETNIQINAKLTAPFIHTIIKLLVEHSICHGPNFFKMVATAILYNKPIITLCKRYCMNTISLRYRSVKAQIRDGLKMAATEATNGAQFTPFRRGTL